MQKKTDLEKVKMIARALLMTEIHETEFSPAVVQNEKVRSLIRRDISFLDEIQTEMATARQFLFIARCRNMKAQQIFARANQIQKAISEQGFEARRMDKGEIKRLLALYFDATMYGEQMPDSDGEQFFDIVSAEKER